MHSLRRILYYFTSLATLLRGLRRPATLLRLVRRPAEPITVELSDGTCYRVRTLMDAWVVKETNLDCDYERHGAPLADGWSIVDVGAGLGDFTIFAARRSPLSLIVAYEPSPESVALLRQNLALNGTRNVRVFQRAVAARRGTLRLDVSGGVAVQFRTAGVAAHPASGADGAASRQPGAGTAAQPGAAGDGAAAVQPGASSARSGDGAANAQPGAAGGAAHVRPGAGQGAAVQAAPSGNDAITAPACLEVESVCLADALDELPGGICDFLKMDCEGAEYDILFNASDHVLARIRRICLEYHDFVTQYSHADLARFLTDRGWRVVVHPSPVRRELGFLYAEQPAAHR